MILPCIRAETGRFHADGVLIPGDRATVIVKVVRHRRSPLADSLKRLSNYHWAILCWHLIIPFSFMYFSFRTTGCWSWQDNLTITRCIVWWFIFHTLKWTAQVIVVSCLVWSVCWYYLIRNLHDDRTKLLPFMPAIKLVSTCSIFFFLLREVPKLL